MRRRLSAIVTAVVLMLSACGDENPARPRDSNGIETATIFPLSVGNKWIYNWAWASDSVTAIVEMDGTEYYRMRGSSLEIAGMPAHVRMNDQEQFLVWWPEVGEQVFFDFGAETGSEWDYSWSETCLDYTVRLESRSESGIVPAGEFSDCYLFVCTAAHAVDADWRFYVAPEVGIVDLGGGKGVHYQLVEFVEGER